MIFNVVAEVVVYHGLIIVAEEAAVPEGFDREM